MDIDRLSLFLVGTYFSLVEWQSMTSVVKCYMRKHWVTVSKKMVDVSPGLPSLVIAGFSPMKARPIRDPWKKK